MGRFFLQTWRHYLCLPQQVLSDFHEPHLFPTKKLSPLIPLPSSIEQQKKINVLTATTLNFMLVLCSLFLSTLFTYLVKSKGADGKICTNILLWKLLLESHLNDYIYTTRRQWCVIVGLGGLAKQISFLEHTKRRLLPEYFSTV